MKLVTIFFQEVDVGIVADVGTLNRIGKVCGNDVRIPFYNLSAQPYHLYRIGTLTSYLIISSKVFFRVGHERSPSRHGILMRRRR